MKKKYILYAVLFLQSACFGGRSGGAEQEEGFREPDACKSPGAEKTKMDGIRTSCRMQESGFRIISDSGRNWSR